MHPHPASRPLLRATTSPQGWLSCCMPRASGYITVSCVLLHAPRLLILVADIQHASRWKREGVCSAFNSRRGSSSMTHATSSLYPQGSIRFVFFLSGLISACLAPCFLHLKSATKCWSSSPASIQCQELCKAPQQASYHCLHKAVLAGLPPL